MTYGWLVHWTDETIQREINATAQNLISLAHHTTNLSYHLSALLRESERRKVPTPVEGETV